MNQFKYLIYACLILFCLVIGVRMISTLTSEQSFSESEITTTSVLKQESKPFPGQSLFQSNCASCHKIQGNSPTAPALAGVWERGPWANREKLYAWIRNPATFKDPYTDGLKKSMDM